MGSFSSELVTVVPSLSCKVVRAPVIAVNLPAQDSSLWEVEIIEFASHAVLGARNRRQILGDEVVKGLRISSVVNLELLARRDDSLSVCMGYRPLNEAVANCDDKGQHGDRNPKTGKSPISTEDQVLYKTR